MSTSTTNNGTTTTKELSPCGTAFAISHEFIVTTRHNIEPLPASSKVVLIQYLKYDEAVNEGRIIEVHRVCDDEDEGWAILKVTIGSLTHFVTVCSEPELPGKYEDIIINSFPVGLIDSESTTVLEVNEQSVRVVRYEFRFPAAKQSSSKKPKLQSTTFPVVPDDAFVPGSYPPDVMVVSGGRVRGSCGAPYFASCGKVAAMHYESVNYDDGSSSISSSHVSYSHGYVLCRMPHFVDWLTVHI
jgi:hypothetical protein